MRGFEIKIFRKRHVLLPDRVKGFSSQWSSQVICAFTSVIGLRLRISLHFIKIKQWMFSEFCVTELMGVRRGK